MKFDKAIVVFEDNTTLWYLRLLERNFRHCYVILTNNESPKCLEINPMSNKLFIKSYHKKGLLSLLQDKKYVVVDCSFVPHKALPIALFSCVEVVKRIVGIKHRFLLTPKKLYTHLLKIGKKSLTFEKNYFTTKSSRWD